MTLFPNWTNNDKLGEAHHFLHQCILDVETSAGMVVNDDTPQLDQNSYIKILNVAF